MQDVGHIWDWTWLKLWGKEWAGQEGNRQAKIAWDGPIVLMCHPRVLDNSCSFLFLLFESFEENWFHREAEQGR